MRPLKVELVILCRRFPSIHLWREQRFRSRQNFSYDLPFPTWWWLRKKRGIGYTKEKLESSSRSNIIGCLISWTHLYRTLERSEYVLNQFHSKCSEQKCSHILIRTLLFLPIWLIWPNLVWDYLITLFIINHYITGNFTLLKSISHRNKYHRSKWDWYYWIFAFP